MEWVQAGGVSEVLAQRSRSADPTSAISTRSLTTPASQTIVLALTLTSTDYSLTTPACQTPVLALTLTRTN